MPLTESQKADLDKLRAEYPGAANEEDITALEKELEDLVDSRQNLDLPAFVNVSAFAEKKVAAFNALLLNDEKLLNDAGKAVLRERNMWNAIIMAFSKKGIDTAVRMLEDVIKSKLTD